MEKQRLFVAVVLDGDLAENCQKMIEQLKQGANRVRVNWTPCEDLHVTLKFLGNVDVEKIPAIEEVLINAASIRASREIQINDLGTFPGEGPIQTIWAGVTDPNYLLRDLAAELDRQ